MVKMLERGVIMAGISSQQATIKKKSYEAEWTLFSQK